MQITVAGWKQKTPIIILVKVIMWGSEAGSSWHFMQQMYRYGPRVTFCLDLWNTIAIITINSEFIRKDLICLFGFTILQTSSFPRPIVRLVLDFSKTRKVSKNFCFCISISTSIGLADNSWTGSQAIFDKNSSLAVSRCEGEVWGRRTNDQSGLSIIGWQAGFQCPHSDRRGEKRITIGLCSCVSLQLTMALCNSDRQKAWQTVSSWHKDHDIISWKSALPWWWWMALIKPISIIISWRTRRHFWFRSNTYELQEENLVEKWQLQLLRYCAMFKFNYLSGETGETGETGERMMNVLAVVLVTMMQCWAWLELSPPVVRCHINIKTCSG